MLPYAGDMKSPYFAKLVAAQTSLPHETEWVEFKRNNCDPSEIGQNISALSNSAALHRKASAYLIWGVEDKTHNVVGTTFRPHQSKQGNQELQNWLVTQLQPSIDVQIFEGDIDGKHVVVFEIQPAISVPIRFRGVEYVRIGSYTKKLTDHEEKERALWNLFNEFRFETGIAEAHVTSDDILSLIDYPSFFRLLELPLPDNRRGILSRLIAEDVITEEGDDLYNISNSGAILFAVSLSKFRRLARKALRVVAYRGSSRVHAIREQVGDRGYAAGFQGAIAYINDQLPQNEQIEQALRRQVRMFPEIAVRELVANALIHQDFTPSGTGPMVEIFDDRMEISNPGKPLIEPLRFIDEPPRSRNEVLARLMRRMNMCEERGSGIDKVIAEVELFQLPAPDFRVAGSSTIAVLYAPRTFAEMDADERIRACYQHACLLYVSGARRMTNASLRRRLGIADHNHSTASRVIGNAIDMGLVRPHSGESGSRRDASYLPFWA